MSTTFPGRRLRRDGPILTALMGELGYYSFDTEAPITAGTWRAIYSSAQVALTAQEHMRQGARSAFALCRPPGHHAGGDFMGGYCFLNNAAIATQAFLDQGARRVAILDVDYHHGNGTQDIFYRRDDVLFASIHGDPRSNTRTSSATQTSAAKAPARAATTTIRWPMAAAGTSGRRRSTTPACGSPATPRMPW